MAASVVDVYQQLSKSAIKVWKKHNEAASKAKTEQWDFASETVTETLLGKGDSLNSNRDEKKKVAIGAASSVLTFDPNDPFESPASMEAYVGHTMIEYITMSVKDIMQEIMMTKYLHDIPEIVTRLLDLPLDFNPQTTDLANEYILDSVNNNMEQTERLAAFWRTVNRNRRRSVVVELKKDFDIFVEYAFLTASEIAGIENDVKVKHRKIKDFIVQLNANNNYDRVMHIALLSIKLCESNCSTSSCRMMHNLLLLSTKSDAMSICLLMVLVDEIAALERRVLIKDQKALLLPVNQHQKAILQIYGRLVLIGNMSHIPTDLQKSAKFAVERKKSEVESLRRTVSYEYDKREDNDDDGWDDSLNLSQKKVFWEELGTSHRKSPRYDHEIKFDEDLVNIFQSQLPNIIFESTSM